MPSENSKPAGLTARASLYFVLVIGVISFFADFSYEGARSVSGPFLALLGASGFVAGAVGGLGELVGYAMRLVSGRWADRSHRYWLIAGAGYLVQMTAIPLLALAASWQAAAALILLERMGKAIRNPPRDVMLAEAGRHIGLGWAFGLKEALDQFGAFLGPLAVAAIYALRADYRLAFAWAAAPGAIVLLLVLSARLTFPEAGRIAPEESAGGDGAYPKIFWWYAVGAGLVGFGFADYALIAFHFAKSQALSPTAIPIAYAFAMLTGGAGALLFGRLFDRFGLMVLVPAILLCAAFAPLSFLGTGAVAATGVLLWGLGLGVQESVMAAAVATMIPASRRASAYGIFTAIFGGAWFLGSALEGALYDISIPALVAVSIIAQLLAIPFILKAVKR